jgi:hypothetical protein
VSVPASTHSTRKVVTEVKRIGHVRPRIHVRRRAGKHLVRIHHAASSQSTAT